MAYKRKNTYNLMDFYRNNTQQHPLRYGHQFTVEFLGRSLNGIETGDFVGADPNSVIDNITYYVQSSSIPKVNIGNVNVPFFAAKSSPNFKALLL